MRREEIAKIDGCIGCHRAPNECKGPGDCRLKNVVEILETALGNKYAEESMHDLTDRILATERTGVEEIICPWPEDLWTMTREEYVKAIPDERLRTAISGFLMREGWNIAIEEIRERLEVKEGV